MPSTTTDRLAGLTTSVAVKPPCRVASTANITLAGLQTIGVVTVEEDDRVLVNGQTDKTKNGIYTASTGDWQRAKDFDGNRDVVQGTLCPVVNGVSGANLYEVSAVNPITIGTTDITFLLRYGANIRYDQTMAEIAASVTPVNDAIPSHDACGYINLFRYGNNTIPGTTDLKAAIDNALLVALQAQGQEIRAHGVIGTTGGHAITTQKLIGSGKASCSFKKLSGGADILFKVSSSGIVQDVTLDGNSLNGSGLQLTTNVADYLPAWLQRVELKNWGASVVTKVITGVTRGATTTVTCTAHGFSNFDIVQIRNLVGVVSASAASTSPVNTVHVVENVTANTFDIHDTDTSGGFTAYSSGGTAEKASYALRIEQTSGNFLALAKGFSDLSFRNNYGNIFLGYCAALNFDRTVMVGNTTGYAVYASNYDCQNVSFRGGFAQSGVRTGPWNVRNLKFEDFVWYLSSGWGEPVYTSQGINEALGNANGEISKTRFINCHVLRNYDASAVPIFKTNNTDMTIRELAIVESGSTNWKVFDDTGTVNLHMAEVSIESTNAWDLFTTTPSYGSAGGYNTDLQNINFYQGHTGNITLSSAKHAAKTTSQCRLRGSNSNVAINAVNGTNNRGYIIENVQGNVNLTNSSVGGTVLMNCLGTITDPNGAVTLQIVGNDVGLKLIPGYTHADNAAALLAGRTAGQLYKTAATGDAHLMIVNAT